jgi:tetratricopeptide (TPR) repeat protein
MRLLTVLTACVLCAATTAVADKRLDDAVAKAEAQLAKGKPDDAVKTLQKAASRAKRDPEAQLALARLLSSLGRRDEAGEAFAKAGDLAAAAPAAVKARVLAGRSVFALRTATVGEALVFARQAVEAHAGPESLAALARAEARAGDPAARETAARAVHADPASGEARIADGDALLAAGLGREAEAAYRRATELDPRSADALAGLALALAAQGKAAPALASAEAAAEADPTSAEARAAVGLVRLAQDPLDKTSDAAAAVQQASILDPKSAWAKLAVGRVFESRGQLAEAAAACAEAADLDPSWAAPRIAALDLQLRQGDAKGALAAFRALPAEMRSSGEARLLLGELLLATGDARGAKAALDAAVEALPGVAEAHALRGKAAYEVGELEVAADALGRAVELDPDDLGYVSEHGLYLAYCGHLDEGLAALVRVTEQPEGRTAQAFVNLGWVYRSFEPPRVEKAVAAYQRALELDPRDGEAALGVARSYRAGRQWARAVQAYEHVPSVDRRLEGEAMLGAAWCYLRSGDDYRARFYTGLAARAGADVSGLRAALTRPSSSAGDVIDQLVDELSSEHPGEQARAVRRLLDQGRAAVPFLAAALRRSGTCLAAREAIVDGLAGMGPDAGAALPSLEKLIEAGPREARSPGSPGAKERAAREEKLIEAMRSAAVRIRGKEQR